MPLLFDDDYAWLGEHGLRHTEVEDQRFFIFRDFKLPAGVYAANGESCDKVDVLLQIPANYNTAGPDMFWTNPKLSRADGKPIPNISGPGEDSRTYDKVEYLRWSRHWNNRPWKPKVDDVRTIIDRLTWAFEHPDAKRE